MLLLLSFVLLIHYLGVLDYIIGVATRTIRASGSSALMLLLGLLVERLREDVGRREESLLLALYLLDVVTGESLLGALEGLLDRSLLVGVHLSVHILQGS